MSDVGAAYSVGAAAWADGPTRVYRQLAERLVDFSPMPLADRRVLDLGSGTGVGSHAAQAAGGRVIAVDFALGMLLTDRAQRPPAAVGDIRYLPFADAAFDLALAPFCLNHLDDPAEGVREAGRVAAAVVASTYAADDDHPAKAAVETALGEAGWVRPDWYEAVKGSMSEWGTVDAATNVIERGGMRPVAVEKLAVELSDLGPADIVAWRLGLAHTAAFLTALDPDAKQRIIDRALEVLGPTPPPLIRRVIFFAATRS